jgi:hypothetical protein
MKIGDIIYVDKEKIKYYVDNKGWSPTYKDLNIGEIFDIASADEMKDLDDELEKINMVHILIKPVLLNTNMHWLPINCIKNFRNEKLNRVL